jgi:hypothetical protein
LFYRGNLVIMLNRYIAMNRACFSKNENLHEQNQHASSPASAGQAIRPLKNDFVRMKTKLFFTALLSFIFYLLSSQVPQGFNYQAIARGSDGIEIVNATFQVKISILTDTAGFYATGGLAGNYLWEEQQTVKTNIVGLFSLAIGNPTAIKIQGTAASFSAISWTGQQLFIGIKINHPVPPGTFRQLGSAKLWSVPYSMASARADSAKGLLKGNKLAVVSGNDLATEALFEVKRKDGQTVFAVYPDAVNIYVPRGAKGITKGGFAIGGFDGKLGPQDYFRVTPDSVRIYIDNTPPVVKGVTKGGFAIGGFDNSKGVLPNYYMNVTGANAVNTVDSAAQILWYPNKQAFLAGKVSIVSADSVGTNSTALGYKSRAIGNYSQAFGYRATARGDYSTSIGKLSVAGARSAGVSTASNAFAFGNGAIATGGDSYAFGSGAFASGYRSFAFGSVGLDDSGNPTATPTTANQPYTFAIGMGAQATQKGAMALGIGSLASGYYSNSFGYYSTSSGYYSTALGFKSTASNYYAGALGYYANAGGLGSLALGYSSAAPGNYATAVGSSARAAGDYASAFGRSATANGPNSVAVGFGATTAATGTDAASFGRLANAAGVTSMALGYSADATNTYSVALGYDAQSTGNTSLAMGYQANASNSYATAIGVGSIASGAYATALGYSSKANGDKSVAIGSQYTYTYYTFSFNKLTGLYTLIPHSVSKFNVADGDFSVAVGNGNQSTDGGIALGSNNTALASGAVAIGHSNTANSGNSFAGGSGNTTSGYNAIALGESLTAQAANSFVIGTYNTLTGSTTTWVETDPLFVIGNGESTTVRHDAFKVNKNGGTYVNTENAYAGLWITSANDANLTGTNAYGLLSQIQRNKAGVTYYSGYFYDAGSALGTYKGLYADLINTPDLYAAKINGVLADVAEYIYDTHSDTEPADVVVADPDNKISVIKSIKPYQTSVVGVISTNPMLTMGTELIVDVTTGDPLPNPKPSARLALTGRVPVKVTNENGTISPGDMLTSSSTPGHAMKWTLLDVNSATDFSDLKRILAENEKRHNAIIGKSVESFTGSGSGKIMVLISLQ